MHDHPARRRVPQPDPRNAAAQPDSQLTPAQTGFLLDCSVSYLPNNGKTNRIARAATSSSPKPKPINLFDALRRKKTLSREICQKSRISALHHAMGSSIIRSMGLRKAMQLGELCSRLNVPYRHLRYILEQGILPKGVDADPGQGEHRDIEPQQAFLIGIVIYLKQNGIRTPLAGKIADYAIEAVRWAVGYGLGWDHRMHPYWGIFETDHQWYVDVGDLTYVRVVTTANPSKGGALEEFPWSPIGKRVNAPDAKPIVIIRLDLARLAHMLHG